MYLLVGNTYLMDIGDMSCATWIDGAEPTNRPNSTHYTMNFPSYCVVWDMDGKLGSK